MEVLILADYTATATQAFAYGGLDYSPRGFACDTSEEVHGVDQACPNPAFVDYRENPEYEDGTYKCQEHAPAFPDVFRSYDVYFDWEHDGGVERRVVTNVIARGEHEALLLYKAFVNDSKLVEGDSDTSDELSDDWNAEAMLMSERESETTFLDYIERAISLDATLEASFEDLFETA